MMTLIVSEESLAGDRQTDTHARTLARTHFSFIYLNQNCFKAVSDFENQKRLNSCT